MRDSKTNPPIGEADSDSLGTSRADAKQACKRSRGDVLPTSRDFAYSAGALLDGWGLMGVKNTAHQVLNIVMGVNPATIGTILAIGRIWDAVTDPVAGNISDNLRTRWGRRRPLIFAGAILCGLTFPLFWWVPESFGEAGQFWWLLLIGIVFYTAFTAFSVPYHALGYEIAPGYSEKTRLFAVRAAVGTLNGIAVAWVFPLIQSGWLGTPRESAQWVGWAVGIGFALLAIIPAVFTKEPAAKPSVDQRAAERISLKQSLSTALKSRPFMQVVGAAALATMGLNAVTVLGSYVSIYYVNGGDVKKAAIIGGLQFTVSTAFIILATPFMKRLADMIGKRDALYFCFGLGILGTISKWFFYTPDYPYLIIGVVFFLGPANAGFRIFADAMIADICEYERVKSGLRLEGTFGAVYTWTLKAGLAAAAFASGWILIFTGFDVHLGGAQSGETLLWLRLAFSFFPLSMLVAACWVVRRYALSAEVMADVRRTIERDEARS